MKKIIAKTLIKILFKILETQKKQYFWEIIFNKSLQMMNFGNGGNFLQSGELNVLKYIKENFDESVSLILFDVGGNVGKYSKTLSDFFNDRVQIHSFEPSQKTFEIFVEKTKNIKNIIPNNFGLSDTESISLLYTNKEGSGLASIYQRKLEHIGISLDKSETIKLSTIDSYCKINNLERIHYLKLDIEGHELKALNGAKEMLDNKKIDFIQFEFGGTHIDSRTYFKDFYYLLKNNYSIYRILKDDLYELPVYKETYEIFLPINYLAILKKQY